MWKGRQDQVQNQCACRGGQHQGQNLCRSVCGKEDKTRFRICVGVCVGVVWKGRQDQVQNLCRSVCGKEDKTRFRICVGVCVERKTRPGSESVCV